MARSERRIPPVLRALCVVLAVFVALHLQRQGMPGRDGADLTLDLVAGSAIGALMLLYARIRARTV